MVAAFPLSSLDSDLLGTVVSKLDGKSYLRLQQTRRDIRDRIRKCRAISVFLNGTYFLLFKKSSFEFYTSKYYTGNALNLELLYGARLNTLHGPENTKGFGHLCSTLYRNRITCRRLFLQLTTCSAEQCEALMAILNPTKIFLNSEGSNRYEGLFQSKTTDNDACGSLLTVLQILRSRPFPNLRSFHFTVSWDKRYFSVSDVEEKLSDFNLTIISKKWKNLSAVVDLPQVVSRQSSCRGVIEDHIHAVTGHIYYKQRVCLCE